MFIIYIWQSQSTRFRSMNVGKEEGGHFSGFSGLPFCGKKLLLADLGAEGASSIRREGGQATYAADEKISRKGKKQTRTKQNQETNK